jgi:predicted alpha/beta-fold hydrolase
MPYQEEPSYKGNKLFGGSHLETIVPALFRKLNIPYERERLELPDGDFMDLDFLRNGNHRILVLFHGLEGSSSSQYIKGMARSFYEQNWDVCCVNFRSCSGEPNRLLRSYHSGATEDIDAVMQHLTTKAYQTISAGGFSLGGNMLLKYIGEQVYSIPHSLKAVFAFSVPIDVEASAQQMAKPSNRVYMQQFLKSLSKKMVEKSQLFPGSIDTKGIHNIKTFPVFDDRYTAPLHGFKDALDYYTTCNSLQFLPHITIPTLLVNAYNDPFLTLTCFPIDLAKQHPFLHLETPKHGGHVGFSEHLPGGIYWSETRALSFISSFCN